MCIPRFILVLMGGVGALLVVGIVVTIVVAGHSETSYPPTSPQGTLASYLRLLQAGQVDRAYATVSMGMDLGQFHQQYDSWSQRSHRVTVVQSSTTDDSTASVTVDISTFSGGTFGASDQTGRRLRSSARMDTG